MFWILKDVPRILFEPYAIGAICGMVTALLLQKNKSLMYWILTCSIAFMMLWRFIMYPIMSSSRYASFLIYPAIILTAFACLRIKDLYQYFTAFRQHRITRTTRLVVSIIIPAILIFGLSLAGLIKTFHINPYRNYTKSVCKAFNELPKGKKTFLYTGREIGRVGYFTNRNDIHFLENEGDIPEDLLISRMVHRLRNIPGEHFFFVFHKTKNPLLTSEILHLQKQDGTIEVIQRAATSRRKDQELVLYRFKPICPNIEEWTEKIPDAPKGNLLLNGEFELALQGKQLEDFRTRCRKDGIREYSDSDGRKLPANCWMNVTRSNRDNPPDIRLLSDSPLAGQNSLYLKGGHPRKTAIVHLWFRLAKGKGRFSMWAKGIGSNRSEIRIFLKAREKDMKTIRDLEALTFLLDGGKTYHIQGDFADTSMQNFCLQIHVDGCVMVDQASVVPL